MAKREAVVDEQPALLDVDHPARPQILRLVREIRGYDDDRSVAQDKGTKRREALAEVMHEHKLTEFRVGEFVAKLKPGKDKVSVRKVSPDEDNNGDE